MTFHAQVWLKSLFIHCENFSMTVQEFSEQFLGYVEPTSLCAAQYKHNEIFYMIKFYKEGVKVFFTLPKTKITEKKH